MLRKYIDTQKPIPTEIEEGNIEYKLRLDLKDHISLKKLISQLSWRLNENQQITGRSEASYYLGIMDDGTVGNITEDVIDESINILKKMADSAKAEIYNIDKIQIDKYVVAEVSIRRLTDISFAKELRLIFTGASSHGKTTLLSNITFQQQDDGNGLGRSLIFKHFHEQSSGITSSIKHEIIGLKEKKLINYKSGRVMTWESIVLNSDKIISIFDLPGSMKYIRTTIFGILSLQPHINFIVISPSNFEECLEETFVAIKMSCLLKIPFIIIFTKADLAEPSEKIIGILNNKIQQYEKTFKMVEYKDQMELKNIVPYISISCKNLNVVKITEVLYNYCTHITKSESLYSDDTEFLVNDVFNIPEKGYIVSGLLIDGKIEVDKTYLIGPDDENMFYPVLIKTIHRKQVSCKELKSDESGSLELKVFGNIEVNKNMIIVSKDVKSTSFVKHCTIELLEQNNDQLKAGHQYNLYFDNSIEPIIVESINKNKLFVKLSRNSTPKYIKDTYCVIKGDPDIVYVGLIRHM